jgi:uncharacterized protein
MESTGSIACGRRTNDIHELLLQSVIFGFVFYSYGFGWFGRLGVGFTLAGGLVFYCAQLIWSRWWLRRFYFGPFEWLWRSISYLKLQPFVRQEWRTIEA